VELCRAHVYHSQTVLQNKYKNTESKEKKSTLIWYMVLFCRDGTTVYLVSVEVTAVSQSLLCLANAHHLEPCNESLLSSPLEPAAADHRCPMHWGIIWLCLALLHWWLNGSFCLCSFLISLGKTKLNSKTLWWLENIS
jgi:hypothetical protein